MILFRARIPVTPSRRSEVIRSLRRTLGPTRASPGCLSCRACMDIEDDNLLVLIEEWADLQSVRAHLCSDTFKVVLAALDCASEQPEVRFDTISGTRDIGFVGACRRGRGAQPWSGDPKPGGGP